jgi:hypothetical protein
MTTLTTMTYGVLPSRALFDAAFMQECPDGYRVRLGAHDSRTLARTGCAVDSNGGWADFQMWQVLTALVSLWEKGDDGAGDLASILLTSLGFEWV